MVTSSRITKTIYLALFSLKEAFDPSSYGSPYLVDKEKRCKANTKYKTVGIRLGRNFA